VSPIAKTSAAPNGAATLTGRAYESGAARRAGLFVPKPSRGVVCQSSVTADPGTIIRQCPLVSAVGTGDRYSPGYSAWVSALATWMQTVGTVPLAVKRCSLVRMRMSAQDSRNTHGLLYLAAVWDDWREQEHRQGMIDTDPSLVRYGHGVGYCRSPAHYCVAGRGRSAQVVCRCGQRWWSESRLTAAEVAGALLDRANHLDVGYWLVLGHVECPHCGARHFLSIAPHLGTATSQLVGAKRQ